jgi:hypothetical protein
MMLNSAPFYPRKSASIRGSSVLGMFCGKIQSYLNFCLSILSTFMRDSKVEGGT